MRQTILQGKAARIELEQASRHKKRRRRRIAQGRAEGKDESGKVENEKTRNRSLIQIVSVESVVKIGSDHTKTAAEKMKMRKVENRETRSRTDNP